MLDNNIVSMLNFLNLMIILCLCKRRSLFSGLPRIGEEPMNVGAGFLGIHYTLPLYYSDMFSVGFTFFSK